MSSEYERSFQTVQGSSLKNKNISLMSLQEMRNLILNVLWLFYHEFYSILHLTLLLRQHELIQKIILIGKISSNNKRLKIKS